MGGTAGPCKGLVWGWGQRWARSPGITGSPQAEGGVAREEGLTWGLWGGILMTSGCHSPPWGGRGTLLGLGTCGCGLSQDHVARDEPFLPSPHPIQISNLPAPVCVCSRGWDWQHCGRAPATPRVPSPAVPSPAGAVFGRALALLRCSQAAPRCPLATLDTTGGEEQLLLV